MPIGQGPDWEMAEELGPHVVITEACPLPKLSLLGHEGTEVTRQEVLVLLHPSSQVTHLSLLVPSQPQVWKEPSSRTLS